MDADEPAGQLTLGVDNSRFIAVTNNDWWNETTWDTGSNRRRVRAIEMLEEAELIDPDYLIMTLVDDGVYAGSTISSGVLNPETGYFEF